MGRKFLLDIGLRIGNLDFRNMVLLSKFYKDFLEVSSSMISGCSNFVLHSHSSNYFSTSISEGQPNW